MSGHLLFRELTLSSHCGPPRVVIRWFNPLWILVQYGAILGLLVWAILHWALKGLREPLLLFWLVNWSVGLGWNMIHDWISAVLFGGDRCSVRGKGRSWAGSSHPLGSALKPSTAVLSINSWAWEDIPAFWK